MSRGHTICQLRCLMGYDACACACSCSFKTAPTRLNLPLTGRAACRNTYKGGDLIEANPSLDWGANLAHMMGAR